MSCNSLALFSTACSLSFFFALNRAEASVLRLRLLLWVSFVRVCCHSHGPDYRPKLDLGSETTYSSSISTCPAPRDFNFFAPLGLSSSSSPKISEVLTPTAGVLAGTGNGVDNSPAKAARKDSNVDAGVAAVVVDAFSCCCKASTPALN